MSAVSRTDWAHAPLSPVALLERAAASFGDELAVSDGELELTYADFHARVRRLSGALAATGMGPGDRVAAVLANTHEMLELHFAAAAGGFVLVPVNVRLSADEMGYVLEHSGAKVVVADRRFADTLGGAGSEALHVWVPDSYEQLLASAGERAAVPADELDLLSINYTSGTTGRPKGVMYTHRGAFLQALNVVAAAGLDARSRYLWTLPMFHCQGWSFTWAVTAVGGRHVCLPQLDPERVWRHLEEDRITHFCGAPTVLNSLLGARPASSSPSPVRVLTGGAPPSPALLERAADAGWEVTHLYGLTETYGPSVVGQRRASWEGLAAAELAGMISRQGVPGVAGVELRVVDEAFADVPVDGLSMGEVVLRGNTVSVGYYRDREATGEAFAGGWFRTGDLAVRHTDGSIELRDRLKDIVVSGGENVPTIEVEQVLAAHPDVDEVAVVAVPDDKWGETPKAFVVPRAGAEIDTDELISFARGRLTGFKAPRQIEIRPDLPKTGTGKIQKFVLREAEWAGRDRRVN